MTDERDCAVDFVKGVLVEVMILFHVINYFIGTQHQLLKYLDFVTGGFVFAAGYVVSAFSMVKYSSSQVQLCLRLLLRGVKIVLLFTLVNVLINLVVDRNYNDVELGIGRFLENAFAIYILGYKQIAAFEILLPIAYALIISALLVLVFKGRRWVMFIISMVFLYCALADEVPYNLIYLSIGLNGFALGLLLQDGHRCAADEKRYKFLFIGLAILYCGIITFYEQTYPLYVFGVIVTLGAFYVIGRDLDCLKPVWRAVVLCGQYSLVAYLSQIVFLQGLFRFGQEVASPTSLPFWVFVITNILVLMVCEGLMFLRERSLLFDRTYRVVFS